MGRRSVSLAVLVLIAVLGFAVTGCGGNNSSAGFTEVTTSTEATTTEAAATTEAATTEAATTEAATTVATTTKAPDLSTFASSKNCREFNQLASKVSQAVTGTGSTDLQQASKFLDELAAKAPSDIRADFKVLADAYSKIADTLKGVDLKSGKAPSADVIAKLQNLQNEVDQKKLTAAEQHISAWVQKNCHA